MEKLIFTNENNEEIEFDIVAQTRVTGVNYLLVAYESEDGEEEDALILKDISSESDPESQYVMVDDDAEFDAVARIFQDELEDEIDIEQ